MTRFVTLVSGSGGNATFLRHGNVRLLIDCGVSGTTATSLLSNIGEDVRDIDYILVTHEHSDHTSGVGVLSRRYKIPVIASEGTWQGMNIGKIDERRMLVFGENIPLCMGDVEVIPFDIPHDGRQPTGYRFNLGDTSVAVATDMGCITEGTVRSLRGCAAIVLESNHDIDMLMNGPYPAQLKARVRGKRGHLSNDDCGELITMLIDGGLQYVLLSHLSEQNNMPHIAMSTVTRVLGAGGIHIGRDIACGIAGRYEPTIVL